MIPARALVSLVAVLLGLSSAPARAGVLVVDASGAGNFTQIAAAVSAAVDGDTLLVKGGTYAGFSITNKSLDVVADVGASVHVQGPVAVTSLSAARTVTLTGMQIDASSAAAPALRLNACGGSVRVQGCGLRGFDQPTCQYNVPGGRAVESLSCSDVAFAACTLRGGKGSDTAGYSRGGSGATAIWTIGTSLAFYDCALEGGVGGGEDGTCPQAGVCCTYGGNGGNGAEVSATPIVYLSNTSVLGGAAGLVAFPSGYGYCGGSGLSLNAASARATQSSFQPGAGVWNCLTPHQGVVLYSASTFQSLTGSFRRINATRVVREQQPARIEFFGQPGDQVRLVIAEGARFAYSDSWHGVSLVRRPHPSPVELVGTLGPSGTLNQAWIVPELGPGVQSRRFFLQAEFVDPAGRKTVSTPATLVLLDSSY